MKKIALLAIIALTLTGCSSVSEKYKQQAWTPDGLNYTMQRDRKTGEMSDYVGFSWSLK